MVWVYHLGFGCAPLEVSLEGAKEDHGNQAGEEEHNHKRVQNRKPVHLYVRMCMYTYI